MPEWLVSGMDAKLQSLRSYVSQWSSPWLCKMAGPKGHLHQQWLEGGREGSAVSAQDKGAMSNSRDGDVSRIDSNR